MSLTAHERSSPLTSAHPIRFYSIRAPLSATRMRARARELDSLARSPPTNNDFGCRCFSPPLARNCQCGSNGATSASASATSASTPARRQKIMRFCGTSAAAGRPSSSQNASFRILQLVSGGSELRRPLALTMVARLRTGRRRVAALMAALESWPWAGARRLLASSPHQLGRSPAIGPFH